MSGYSDYGTWTGEEDWIWEDTFRPCYVLTKALNERLKFENRTELTLPKRFGSRKTDFDALKTAIKATTYSESQCLYRPDYAGTTTLRNHNFVDKTDNGGDWDGAAAEPPHLEWSDLMTNLGYSDIYSWGEVEPWTLIMQYYEIINAHVWNKADNTYLTDENNWLSQNTWKATYNDAWNNAVATYTEQGDVALGHTATIEKGGTGYRCFIGRHSGKVAKLSDCNDFNSSAVVYCKATNPGWYGTQYFECPDYTVTENVYNELYAESTPTSYNTAGGPDTYYRELVELCNFSGVTISQPPDPGGPGGVYDFAGGYRLDDFVVVAKLDVTGGFEFVEGS